MTTALDVTPLTAPMTRDEVRAWRSAAKARGAAWASFSSAQLASLAILLPFAGIFLIVGFFFSAVLSSPGGPQLVPIVFVVVPLLVIGGGLWATFGSRAKWERWARIDRFATANGFVFSPADPDPYYPGAIFGLGDSRSLLEHVRNGSGRVFDLGNYRYTTGSGKNKSTHSWGFLAFRLDRKLPHMVLDSRANNGLFGGTNLPASFDKDQVLQLEGNFNEFFTLYCPSHYERDALYVFTPDLMTLLIDEAAPFDVEIIDDWMFVYSASEFDMAAAETYQRLFGIIDTVGAKTLTQTDRYVDERVGVFESNIVAPQGARLKRRVSVISIVVIAGFIAFWLWNLISDVVSVSVG